MRIEQDIYILISSALCVIERLPEVSDTEQTLSADVRQVIQSVANLSLREKIVRVTEMTTSKQFSVDDSDLIKTPAQKIIAMLKDLRNSQSQTGASKETIASLNYAIEKISSRNYLLNTPINFAIGGFKFEAQRA